MGSKSRAAFCFLSALIGISGWAVAQGQVSAPPQQLSRIVQPISDTQLVLLRGNTRPETRFGTDLGGVDPLVDLIELLLAVDEPDLQRGRREEDHEEADHAPHGGRDASATWTAG